MTTATPQSQSAITSHIPARWARGSTLSAQVRITALGLMSALLLAQGACRTPAPPVPPPHNATFGEGVSINGVHPEGTSAPGWWDPQRQPTGNTRLRARYISSDKFGERRRGDWIESWEIVRFDVLAVERGTWTDPTLSFIVSSSWPTPESGIMVMMPAWPFRKGAEYLFEIETRPHAAVIVDILIPVAPSTQPTSARSSTP